MPMLMYPKLKEASLIPRLKKTFFLDMDKEYGLYDKDKRIFYSRNVAFNETTSTKQDDVKDVAEDQPSTELKMDCQREDDNTINYHVNEEPQQER